MLASGGVDSTINVWDLENKKVTNQAKLCHTGGGINALVFVGDTTVATCGSDGCIKTWAY